LIDVSVVLTAFIIRAIIVLMMESGNTSKISVNLYHTTRRNNTEDIHLHTRRRENLKSRRLRVWVLRRITGSKRYEVKRG
jgi:hypothetical protein